MEHDSDAAGAIPEAWRNDAEQVRAHLVSLRGASLFLSSADAWQLVCWFDDGVGVAPILRALERAALARRAKRSKIPLSLGHCKRHLGKPLDGGAPSPPPPLDGGALPASTGPLAATLGVLSRQPEASAALDQLRGELAAVSERSEAAFVAAVAASRRFFAARYDELGEPGREALRATGRLALGDLLRDLDDATAAVLVEEAALDTLRQGYPALGAHVLWELLDPEGADGQP